MAEDEAVGAPTSAVINSDDWKEALDRVVPCVVVLK